MFTNPVVRPLPSGPDRFSRIRDMLIECNFLINLIDDEEDLLKGLCHLIVDAGGFSRAWVRLTAAVALGDSPENAGQNGTRPIQKDYYFASSNPARRSSMVGSPSEPYISLPIKDEHSSLGVLTLYSSDSEPFDEQETGLLTWLASNLATRLVSLHEQRRLAPGQPHSANQPAWQARSGHEQAAQLSRQPLINLLNG